MKEFIVKEDLGFRLRVKSWKCLSPNNINAIEFIQECLGKEGQVDSTSTYQFFMTDQEVKLLCEKMLT